MTRESTIEEAFCNAVYRAGGTTRKLLWVGRGGAPDRFVALPSAGVILVELKRPGKDAEEHQAREYKRLNKVGVRTAVVATLAEIDAFIQEFTDMDDAALIARLRTGRSIFEQALLALILRQQAENERLTAELERAKS